MVFFFVIANTNCILTMGNFLPSQLTPTYYKPNDLTDAAVTREDGVLQFMATDQFDERTRRGLPQVDPRVATFRTMHGQIGQVNSNSSHDVRGDLDYRAGYVDMGVLSNPRLLGAMGDRRFIASLSSTDDNHPVPRQERVDDHTRDNYGIYHRNPVAEYDNNSNSALRAGSR